MRAIESGRGEGAMMRWALLCGLCVGALSVGCVLGEEGGDGGLFGDFTPPPSPSDEDWMEDAEDRRKERDNPRSVDYRGDFEVKLEGEEVSTSIDGAALGEATFKHVSQDLVGTPPHCQITLADRQPDAMGAQGYVIVQILGPNCDVEPGELVIYGSWQEQSRDQSAARGAVLKTVQVSVETDEQSTYYDYRMGQGTLEITQLDRGELIQAYVDAKMTQLSVNDEPARDTSLSVRGGFGAVVAP